MSADSPIGKTARGQAVYSPTHPSYAHLEKVRMLGVDKAQLGQLARQAHPHYRAVDHEEASIMHHSRQNFHAARAHEAASEAMSKADGAMVPAYDSNLSWVYEGADPTLTLQDAAGAITAVTLTWSPQDHLDNAVLQHCLAQSLGESGLPEDLEKQALCAAAAYMHFAAAGVDPTSGAIGASIAQSPMAKALAQLAKAELGKSAAKATQAELKGIVSKALDPRALRPIKPRTPTQIGSTRSGKPIFDVYHHPAHKEFSKEDWADAGKAVGQHTMHINNKIMRTPVKKSEGDVVKGNKPLGAAFSHARKVAAKTGGGKAKEREVAQRYLSRKGHGKMAAKSMADGELEKGKGKGSRGGVIVGFAPNGSPIYSGHRVRSSKARKEAVAEAKKDDTNKSLAVEASNQRGNAVQKLLMKAQGGKGEGSRGGKIIGHTKSGKPIYARNESSYYHTNDVRKKANQPTGRWDEHAWADATTKDHPNYSAQDHVDAANAHRKKADIHHDKGRLMTGSDSGKKVRSGNMIMQAGYHHDALAESHMLASQKMKSPQHFGEMAGPVKDYHGEPEKERRKKTKASEYKSLGKSLDALHPSDGLHQMGAQFAQKHPKMSASDHMSESSKYAKAGQPHMAIGHLMASSYKSAVAKKSMACDVLKSFLASPMVKAETYGTAGPKLNIGYGVKKPTTGSGKPIPSPSAKHYKSVNDSAHSADFVAAAHSNGAAIKQHFAGWTAQDHHDAAAHHEDSNHHAVAGAHFGLGGHYGARKTKSDPYSMQAKKSLSKAEGKGEGSRGGKIIGHTKSGHPIYAPSAGVHEGLVNTAKMDTDKKSKMQTLNAMVTHQRHRHYTAQDHQDAANAHKGHMESKASLSLRQKHGSLADAHATVAAAMKAGHLESPKIKKSLSKPQTEFDALLKASGITMWAQKADRAASLVVN